MSSDKREPSPDFIVVDGPGKGKVEEYQNAVKFHVGDLVYLVRGRTQSGPYVIASGEDGKFTLSLKDGTSVNDGEEVDESDLEHAPSP